MPASRLQSAAFSSASGTTEIESAWHAVELRAAPRHRGQVQSRGHTLCVRVCVCALLIVNNCARPCTETQLCTVVTGVMGPCGVRGERGPWLQHLSSSIYLSCLYSSKTKENDETVMTVGHFCPHIDLHELKVQFSFFHVFVKGSGRNRRCGVSASVAAPAEASLCGQSARANTLWNISSGERPVFDRKGWPQL